MKIKLLLFVLPFLLACISPNVSAVCMASSVLYYRIIDDQTNLYATSTMEQAYFCLPKTYFVEFIDNVNDDIAFVRYDDLEGFVYVNQLQACYSQPTTPFAQNQTLSSIDACNVIVYSQPNTSSQFVGVVPFNAQDITYYGSIQSVEAIQGLGNLWHYIKYTSYEQGILHGFVYAPLTTNLKTASVNDEIVVTENEETVNTSTLPINAEFGNSDTLFIIIGLCILALILLSLLFRTDKRKKPKLSSSAPNLPREKLTYMAKHTENDGFDF